jgi:hypothetical protein
MTTPNTLIHEEWTCISMVGVVMYKCVRSGHVYVWYEWSCISVLGVVMCKCVRSGLHS